MTQSQTVPIFYSCTSIAAWAGTPIHFVLSDLEYSMPYIERDGLWYYFGMGQDGAYRLLMTSSKNLED